MMAGGTEIRGAMSFLKASAIKKSVRKQAVPNMVDDSGVSARRVPVVGGNWKSNGDRDFISTFPEEVLNKSSWDSEKLEVCVAPTDIHLSDV